MKYKKLLSPIEKEGEVFKPCYNVEGYEISNMGNLRSVAYKFNKSLKTNLKGYKECTIRKVSYSIHRLVLMTHNPVDNMKNLWVNHINHDRGDNRLENLEWVTPRQNNYHSNKKPSDSVTKMVGIQKTRKRDYAVRIYLGRFKTFEEAQKVLLEAYNKLGLDSKYLERE